MKIINNVCFRVRSLQDIIFGVFEDPIFLMFSKFSSVFFTQNIIIIEFIVIFYFQKLETSLLDTLKR